MTDYFALLNQPRRPWINPEEVKQAFHARALQVHPVAQPNQHTEPSSDALFAQLNQAYQVLQDPKRRLQHLLTLEGHPPERSPGTIPTEIEELFPIVATATHRSEAIVKNSAAATNALSRSLLKSELQHATNELRLVREQVRDLHGAAIARLQQLDRSWSGEMGDQLEQLRVVYVELSYITRWLSELDEKKLQLSTC